MVQVFGRSAGGGDAGNSGKGRRGDHVGHVVQRQGPRTLRFRFVEVPLRGNFPGIGRYQPHSATDVLSNDFGDCKDKHTLFAALLAAENIKAMPVLINSSAKIDPDVPSPAQFDHVITALPQGNGYQFLDTTPEVAPYGLRWAACATSKAC